MSTDFAVIAASLCIVPASQSIILCGTLVTDTRVLIRGMVALVTSRIRSSSTPRFYPKFVATLPPLGGVALGDRCPVPEVTATPPTGPVRAWNRG